MLREAVQSDLNEIVDMALKIFVDSNFTELYDEFLNVLSDNNAKVFCKMRRQNNDWFCTMSVEI